MTALVQGLDAPFTRCGGVPAEVLFDQLKAVIQADRRPHGRRVLENPEFLPGS